ncbi:MAG: hypothetical protein J0H12_07650 [Candidatus Paracaedimonas acanthamoebae]|uniref:Uncharacterized protein n=1 Tax=Candidatus Paracaedimonas acanthamoebae TaxID=244581 RepID=A0A8J7PSF7_9PROT|nr:hypothetical protein [Candidatus Paracaedimonas acanthamoebae]
MRDANLRGIQAICALHEPVAGCARVIKKGERVWRTEARLEFMVRQCTQWWTRKN